MIDFTKPVRTKSGKPVKILTTNGNGDCPIVAIVGNSMGRTSWNLQGAEDNLENIPENVYLKDNMDKLDIQNPRSRPYQQTLLEGLKDPKEAMAYLEAALNESNKTARDSTHLSEQLALLRDAVKNVIEANKEPEQFAWINIYIMHDKLMCGAIHYSKQDAEKDPIDPDLVGRLKIKLERGRFDE